MPIAETDLQEVLIKMAQVIEDLLEVACQETEALKKDDLMRLTGLIEEQQQLAEKLQALEEQRLEGLAAFRKANGLEEELSLGQLMAFPQFSAEFRENAQALWDKFQLLREQQELNSMLLNQSLQYTRKMMSVFNYGITYQPDGRLEQMQASTSLLDKSI